MTTIQPVAHGCADHASVDSADAAGIWIQLCRDHGWVPTSAVELVPVTEALGRVTSGPVRSQCDVPAQPISAMDGVAVPAAAATFDDHGDAIWAAGSWCMVDTGDSLPTSTDTVIRREHLRIVGDAVHTQRSVAVGSDVRARGSDMSCGEVILPARHRIRPVDLAALAGAGLDELPVLTRPVVAVVPTGDEIRTAGTRLAAGEMRDTNSIMLAGELEQIGARPLLLPVVPDDPGLLRAAITDAARQADLVLVIAGTSLGRDDHTADVLASLGTLAFRGVAMRPGHPVMAAVLDGDEPVPAVGLPGYPIAAVDAFDLLARPILETTASSTASGSVQARLGAPLSSTPGLRDTLRVRLTNVGGPDVGAPPVAVPLPRGSSAVSTLVAAEGVVRIPAAHSGYATGDAVTVELVAGAVAPGRTVSIWGPADSTAARKVEQSAHQRFPRGVVCWTDAPAGAAVDALLDGWCHAAVVVIENGSRPPTMPAHIRSITLTTDGAVTELLLARRNADTIKLFTESGAAQCVTQ